jgi:autotransporter-associated beta strand protein
MKITKLAVLIPSLVLALNLPVFATTQFWNPGLNPSAGGLWDTTTANWGTAFGAGGGDAAWTQGNDAAFTVGATYLVTVSGLVTVGNVTVLGSANALTLVQSTTANTLCFPSGNCTFDTGSRVVSQASGSGFNSAAGTVLTKKGTGTLSIQPAGKFAGKWIIQDGGFVSLGSQGAYFGTSTADDTVTLNNGGIRLSAGVRTISGTGITIGAGGGQLQPGGAGLTIDVTAKISGAGSFTVNSANATASLVLDNAGNAFSGPLSITGGGICKVGVAGAMPSGLDITLSTSGTTLDFNGTSMNVNSIASSAGTLAIGAGSLTISGTPSTAVAGVFSGSGKLIKGGSGTVTFSGSNTGFTGEFVVNSGTVGVGGTQALGAGATGSTVTLNGGKLANNSTSGRTIPATVAVNLAGDFIVDESLIAGPGQILFNGGATTIKNGNRTITVNGAANLGLGGVVGQDVAGRGLIKSGNGILALTAINTYSGDTTVNAGQININGTSTLGDGTGTLHLRRHAELDRHPNREQCAGRQPD